MAKNQSVELGDLVKSEITGQQGVVVCMAYWLYGCVRVSYQPQESKDGKPADIHTVDVQELRVIKKGAIKRPPSALVATPPAGPRPDPNQLPNPSR